MKANNNPTTNKWPEASFLKKKRKEKSWVYFSLKVNLGGGNAKLGLFFSKPILTKKVCKDNQIFHPKKTGKQFIDMWKET